MNKIDLTKTGPDRIAAVASLRNKIADIEAATTPETISEDQAMSWSEWNLDLAHLLFPNGMPFDNYGMPFDNC